MMVQFYGEEKEKRGFSILDTRLRRDEKKGKMGVEGEIRGRGKEKASYVRRKGSRQQSEGMRMWRGGGPGEVSMGLSICPSSTRLPSCHCLPSSIRIINIGWISSM